MHNRMSVLSFIVAASAAILPSICAASDPGERIGAAIRAAATADPAFAVSAAQAAVEEPLAVASKPEPQNVSSMRGLERTFRDKFGNVLDRSVTDSASGAWSQAAPIICAGLAQGVFYHAYELCGEIGAYLAGDLGKKSAGDNREFDGRYFVDDKMECSVGPIGVIIDRMTYTLHFRCVDDHGRTVPLK